MADEVNGAPSAPRRAEAPGRPARVFKRRIDCDAERRADAGHGGAREARRADAAPEAGGAKGGRDPER
jgi:hypothetical protein